ncbi:hypothetical protein [Corynebacterium lubricantis]|uniref:hypothetical protein n=1 Tax=Corynebacterium lubricantis TaxID=541095 RepID=UPI00036C405B|nr:hypothetical protein [Corynebacterium lubricantis]
MSLSSTVAVADRTLTATDLARIGIVVTGEKTTFDLPMDTQAPPEKVGVFNVLGRTLIVSADPSFTRAITGPGRFEADWLVAIADGTSDTAAFEVFGGGECERRFVYAQGEVLEDSGERPSFEPEPDEDGVIGDLEEYFWAVVERSGAPAAAPKGDIMWLEGKWAELRLEH